MTKCLQSRSTIHPSPVLNSQSSFVIKLTIIFAHKSAIATHVPSLASCKHECFVLYLGAFEYMMTELGGHYGANESQTGDCKHFVRNGRLGKRALLIEVSTLHIGLHAPPKSVSWKPLTNWASNFACKPHKKRGRPSARWDDSLTDFSSEFFHNDKWWHIARETSSWFTSEKFYVQFCPAQFGL